MNRREHALNILYRVMHDHGYASLIMREEKDIAEEEMPFVTETVYGTLRNYLWLEAQWKPYARKKAKMKTALLLDLAVYQMFLMHKPAYAVVSESVDLAEKGERGFVNAILHRVAENGERNISEPWIRYSHPKWIYDLWCAHYGSQQALAIMKADQNRPVITARINPLKTTEEEVKKNPSFHFLDDLLFTSDEPVQKSPLFAQGKVVIQNPSSVKAALYLEAQPGDRVLDLCAAPGTKTQMIAACMKNQGEIVACDLYPQRVSLIGDLMEKTGVQICKTKVSDAEKEHAFADESFDRILCDVPCSGLGDLSHKPEIRWHLKPENIDSLLVVQQKILDNAAVYLKPGGTIVYSTCTLDQKENEKQVSAFLKRHPEFELKREETVFPGYGDGFYMAQLSKKQSNMIK